MSTSDFEPRYLELWRDAAAAAVRIPVPSKQDAFAFRHRLYRCRLAMKAEKHEWYELARGVTASIIEVAPDGKERAVSGKEPETANASYIVLMRNPDQRFAEALMAAGYEPPKAPSLD